MSKHKPTLQIHHFYLGVGGMLSVAALVIALTFGLSSAEEGMMMNTAEMQSACTSAGGTWNGSSCQMPNTSTNCGSGQYWNGSSCITNPTTTTTDMQSACTSAGGTWNSANTPPCTMPQASGQCPSGYTGTPPNCMPPSCPSGQNWDSARAACVTTGGYAYTEPRPPCSAYDHEMPADPEHGNQAWCMPGSMGSGTTTYPGGYTPPASGTPPSTGCPQGQFWNGTACVTSSTQYPTGCTGPMPTGGCQSGSHFECVSNAWQCKQDMTSGTSTMQPPVGTQQQCGQGYHWTPDMGCVKDMYPAGARPAGESPMPPPSYFQPGQCPQEMFSCDDPWMPGNKVCKPKQFFSWDPSTQKSTQKEMTCDSWAQNDKEEQEKWKNQSPGFGPAFGPSTGPMPFGGPFGGPGMSGMPSSMPWFEGGHENRPGKEVQGPMNPCEFNPNDPFCKAGYDFGKMQDQYKFDQSQFVPQEDKNWSKKRLQQELRNLKMEAKDWARDIEQVQQQLTEIGRESSGFACPFAVEVSAIVTQLKDAVSTVNALSATASAEDIQKAMGLRDFVNGRWDGPELVAEGLRQKLFGGPFDEETGEPTPGKIQSLGVCRDISNVIRDACSLSKNISREAVSLKKKGAPETATAVFDEVVSELTQICTNSISVLQSKGVALEELSEPWRPDPEVCGFGFGGGPMPGPGPMPMPFFEMGPGGGPGPGMFENFDPEMMKRMQGKFQEFNKGGFPGGFNPFGASVLSAAAGFPEFVDDEEFGEEEEEFGGQFENPFGGPGPRFEFQEPEEECIPPIHRYLDPHKIMRKLDEARFDMDRQFETMNVCNMLEMAKDFLNNEDEANDGFGFGPPPQIVKLVQGGEWEEACKSGDSETLTSIQKRLFAFGGPGQGRGPKDRRGFGGLVDIDKLVKDKMQEKIDFLYGFEEGEEEEISDEIEERMKELEGKISNLQSQLDDAAKTILALNERLSEMTAKLASAVELSEKATQAVNSIAKLPNEEVQQTVTNSITLLIDKVEEAKAILPPEGDKLLDSAMNSILVSPPSSQVVNEIAGNLNTIVSYAQSGAKKTDIVEKVKDKLAEVAVLNATDLDNKIEEGIVASSDTSDLSQWYAIPALAAKEHGFIAKELKEIKPGEPETKCAALTRVARIDEKATGEEIDMSDKTLDQAVPGAPDWCLPFLSYLQEKDIPFVENLKDPNATIDRSEIAVLLHQVVGDRLPDPPSSDDYLTPDVNNLPLDEQVAIAEMRYNGIMDSTDGQHFSPDVDFNRAQNALVSTKAYEAILAAENQ